MQNTKNNKSKKFLNIVLVALLAVTVTSASVMMGCDSKETSATPDSAVTETKVVSETQIVTELVDITGDDSDESGDASDSKSGDSKNKSNSNNSNSNDKSDDNKENGSGNSGNKSNNNAANNSGNNSDNKNNNSDDNGGNDSDNNSDNNADNNDNNNSGNNSDNNGGASGVLKIGGKSFNVGDTITCTLSIKTPELIENFQGQIVYDTKYLECTKAKFVGEARSGSVINSRTTPGIIKFNGSSAIDGYDFTDGAAMMEITYKVKGSGSTTPTEKWEIVRRLTEKGNGTNYITDGKPSKGMTSSFSYSK